LKAKEQETKQKLEQENLKKSGKSDKNNTSKGFNKSQTEIKLDYIQLFEKH